MPGPGVCVCLFGRVSAPRGGVPGAGGFMLLGGVPGPGGCLVQGGAWSGGSAPEGVCLVRGGVCSGGCAWSGGCLLWGGLASQHALRQTPSPPPRTESQTPVKTLLWPNFVAAGNNNFVSFGSFYFNPGQNMRQVVN